MTPYVRNLAIVAAVLFVGGAYVIMTYTDPNAGLNRQPVKPPPKIVKIIPPNDPPEERRPAGVVATFSGGKFGASATATKTPVFEVDHDWTVVVETKGEFSRIGCSPADLPKRQEPKTPEEKRTQVEEYFRNAEGREFDVFDPPPSFKRDFSVGGKYRVWFEGNGVWKVTIHQGTGKLP